MGLSCAVYKLLDAFRHTRLAARLFYFGVPVTTIRPYASVVGRVVGTAEGSTDGDVNFNIELADGQRRHCEVTPCAPDQLRNKARALKMGQRVVVRGQERFDPKHVGSGSNSAGWLEIHPVTDIIVLGKGTTNG